MTCSLVFISYLCSHVGDTRAITDVTALSIVWKLVFSLLLVYM